MAAEIISTVERRRHWPDEEKLRILSEALAPGATVAAVADGNGVCRSLVYLWLRLARAGQLPGIALADPPRQPTQGTSFVPVRIEPPVKPARLSSKTAEDPSSGLPPQKWRAFLIEFPNQRSRNGQGNYEQGARYR